MNKTTLHSLILWLAGIFIVVGFLYYLYANLEKYAELLQLSVMGILSIFLISLFFPLINGMQNALVYRELGAIISYRDSLVITTASTLANQLPISGGIISKGIYLKKRFGFSYVLFASSILALFICFISVSGFVGLVILIYWLLSGSVIFSLPLFIGYLAMTFSFVFFILPFDTIWLPDRVRAVLRQAVDGWYVLGKNSILLTRLVTLQTLLLVLLALRFWLAFHMLSQNITFSQALLFSAASILTQLAGFAPGGLGIRELIVGAVAGVLGLDMSIGVLAVGLDRLVSTPVVFLAGWIGTVLLGKQFTEEMNEG